EIEFAAAGVADLAFVDRLEAGGAEKPVDRLRPRPDPRAAPLVALVRLMPGDAVGNDREAAWRHIAMERGCGDLGGGELVANERHKVLDRTALHARRDLLRQEFEEEFAHLSRPTPPARFRSRRGRVRVPGRYRRRAR